MQIYDGVTAYGFHLDRLVIAFKNGIHFGVFRWGSGWFSHWKCIALIK